eukprot:1589834-Alexandrium_andersonii.AAC.1
MARGGPAPCPLPPLAALAAFAALPAPAALWCSSSPVTLHRGGGPAASVMARCAGGKPVLHGYDTCDLRVSLAS